MRLLLAALALVVASLAGAQVNVDQTALNFRYVSGSVLAAAVPNSSTQVMTVGTRGIRRIKVTCTNAVNALAGFAVKTLESTAPVASISTLASVTADYTTTIKAPMIAASSDLTLLGAGATGWFILDTGGLDQVYVFATSGNVGGSTLSCYVAGF